MCKFAYPQSSHCPHRWLGCHFYSPPSIVCSQASNRSARCCSSGKSIGLAGFVWRTFWSNHARTLRTDALSGTSTDFYVRFRMWCSCVPWIQMSLSCGRHCTWIWGLWARRSAVLRSIFWPALGIFSGILSTLELRIISFCGRRLWRLSQMIPCQVEKLSHTYKQYYRESSL